MNDMHENFKTTKYTYHLCLFYYHFSKTTCVFFTIISSHVVCAFFLTHLFIACFSWCQKKCDKIFTTHFTFFPFHFPDTSTNVANDSYWRRHFLCSCRVQNKKKFVVKRKKKIMCIAKIKILCMLGIVHNGTTLTLQFAMSNKTKEIREIKINVMPLKIKQVQGLCYKFLR